MNQRIQIDSKMIIRGLVGALIIFLAFLSVSYVPVNSVGIKYNNLSGKIYENPVQSGLRFKIPIVENITTVSTEIRSADIDDVKITTKDSQGAEIDIELQYKVLPEDARDTFMQFRSTREEDWIKTFVYQQIQRGVQEATSKYTISELLGEKRGDFQAEVDQTVKKSLENNHLTLQSASVDDIDVSQSIREAIEKHAKAKQEVETAKQNKLRQEVENETKIEQEKAEAEVKKIKAEAEADANQKLSEGITPELIEYLEAEARKTHGWYKYNNMDPVITEKEE